MRTDKRTVLTVAAAVAVLVAAPLIPAVAGHSTTVLETELSGRAEVGPTTDIVGDANGRGQAFVFGVDGDATTLCYVLVVDKIAPATAAHIHKGAAGSNGPVVVNLAAPADGNAGDCLTEGEAGKFVGGQTVAEILANPEGFYINVHNAEFPGGAIRGQLAAQH